MADNPWAKYGVSDAEIAQAIASSAEVDADLNRVMEQEMVPMAKNLSPVDSGDYAAAWEVTKRARRGKGQVGNKHWRAHLMEFGTGSDAHGGTRYTPGTGTQVTEDTPTPAFAVGQQVASHFGGDLTDGGLIEL